MKKLLAILISIAAIATFGAVQLHAEARDCDTNSVINCGAYTAAEFTQKFNQNATGDLPGLYAHYGINPAAINSAKSGTVMKNGDIIVDGKIVATGGRSVGRTNKPGSTLFTVGNTKFYERPNSVSFAANSISAFVFFDDNGQFVGAILKSCGNAVKAIPVPVPPKPIAACVNLVAVISDRNKVRFTATASASNGAQITGYVFDFGDSKTASSTPNIVDHTYAAAGTFTAKVTVKTSLDDKTSPACSTPVTIAPQPVAECKTLIAAITNRTDYKLTAVPTLSGGATVTSYTFVVKNNDGAVVKTMTQTSPELTGTLQDGTYSAQVTITTSLGDRTNDGCKTDFTITPQPLAECKKLMATISNRTHYALTATGSVSGGASISGYQFVIKDSAGKVVSSVDSTNATVEGDLTAGDYAAQVTIKTSLSDRTGDSCKAELSIGVENCTIPGKENLPKDSPLCVETPPELPKTGLSDGIGALVGASSIVASIGYYVASRRGLLAAMLGR